MTKVTSRERLGALVALFKLRIFTLLWAESIVGLLLAFNLLSTCRNWFS